MMLLTGSPEIRGKFKVVRTVKGNQRDSGEIREILGNEEAFSIVWDNLCFPDKIRDFVISLECLCNPI